MRRIEDQLERSLSSLNGNNGGDPYTGFADPVARGAPDPGLLVALFGRNGHGSVAKSGLEVGDVGQSSGAISETEVAWGAGTGAEGFP